ncbi:sulfurtransferase [Pseudooceanicola sediminis]|uniref:Sulfurtransferase n=1 Tax=Pseudooceanicola sediminis TaxID=2211117 RepID=A0A399J0V8_9RHOB|nr:rhodanese-like domain-containing protein [Pseudooceanicola sediminis]KAA2315061.1 sulfurtransferase [Puniceibacterium sp. HSS470]RII38874.1 sulfurtransferase [Pseudooceanicola sediminis]
MKTFLRSTLTAASLAAGLAVSSASTGLAANDFGPLVTPSALSDDLGQSAPLVLDIRGDVYEKGHIPGAVSAPYGLFRGPASNPGQLVPEDKLEATLQDLGITKSRPVVVVHQGSDDSDFGAAARVYWTLKSSGVSQLAILNGGMNAWAAAGFPTNADPVTPVKSDIDITFSHQWLADTDEVASIVDGDSNAVLVDSRPAAFYEGKQSHGAASRPGTLPGAENVAHSEWFVPGTPSITDSASAASLAEKFGLNTDEEVVAFCNTGHWAATDWFALSELAGVPNVKLYPDSMVGYSQTDHEMANTPGLLQNLMNQLKGD